MIDHAGIAALIPHHGAMCLLDRVIAWNTTAIHCQSIGHRDAANPLATDGQLAAICGIEYAAQAMAAHGALTADTATRPRAGYLASVRDVQCATSRLDDLATPLNIHAEMLLCEDGRVIYSFAITCNDAPILSGRAAVVLDAA